MEENQNQEVADLLERIAGLLESKQANRFRIQAYREAAETVRGQEPPLSTRLQEGGEQALQQLPGIGEGISGVIAEYLREGRSTALERLLGETAPERLFQEVPGIGETLAERIAEELDVSSLEGLEEAARDGRLQEVVGFGSQKVENVRLSLAGMLGTDARRRQREGGDEAAGQDPPVKILLEVDKEYRRQAQAGKLPRIAPKRFNPEKEAWLPILETTRGAWKLTALFSNTARAHQLGKTDDWVVLYYHRDGEEDQATVVTETQGPLKGKRVVRGREGECRAYYRATNR